MMSNDKSQLQQILVQLAGTTVRPELMPNPDLPTTWKSLKTESVPTVFVGKIQLLLAEGDVGDDTVSCLSVGVPWSEFLGKYTSGFNPDEMAKLPEEVTGEIPDNLNAMIMSVYVAAYSLVRSSVWEILSFLSNSEDSKNTPIYITGMGLGGPLAQIIALDLRPNHTGPGEYIPKWTTQPPCYAFSTGNFANLDFQTYYQGVLKDNAFNYRAGTPTLKVDQFPDAPFNNNTSSETSTIVPLGTVTHAPIPVPDLYTPWEVRDSNFYLKAFDGTPPAFPATPTVIPAAPTGFSQPLSYTLATYMADTYAHAQQPQNAAPPPMVKSFDCGANKVMAAIFEASNLVVLAFRGSITFEEFLAMDANSTTAVTPYSETVTSGVATFLYRITKIENVGTESNPKIKEYTFAEELAQEIKDNYCDKDLYIIGHGFGGAMANAMAADIFFNSTSVIAATSNLKGIYTYGACYFAGTGLATQYNGKLADKSYQLRRPGDTVATALKSQRYFNPVDTLIDLIGSLDFQENTNHAMSSYAELLNPQRKI